MLGHGMFNWWGFSPPLDFCSYLKDNASTADARDREVVQVVVVGAGDPRHLLLTLAKSVGTKRLRIFILEAYVEVYARLLLLLGAGLQVGMGVRERATLLLDLWANLYLRPTSRTYLELVGRRFSMAMTDEALYSSLIGLVSASRLKYRERDAMDAVCRSWFTLSAGDYDPSLSWEVRLRQLLKTRYDSRRAEADWAWHMRLAFRIQQLQTTVKETEASKEQRHGRTFLSTGWGQEFLTWREDGRALALGADTTPTLPNTSLASVATVVEGSTKHRRIGYWGDVLTGPFPALALASTDLRAAKAQNNRNCHSGSEVALWNMESLLDELWATYLQDTHENTDYANGAEKPEAKDMTKSKSSSAEEHLENLSDTIEKLHIQRDKDGLAASEGRNTSLTGKEISGEANIRNPESNTHSANADTQNMNVTLNKNETSSVTCDKDDREEASNSHSGAVGGSATNRSEQEDNENSSKRVKSHPPRKKSSVEGGRAYIDYLKLEGVEIILLSPSRLNDLSSLSEIEGELDLIYLSAAMAHMMSPSFFLKHRGAHTQLLLETVQMFPQLTDDQVKEYQTRVTASAGEAGWEQHASPHPLCHLRFHR
ncbi:dynein axonemal assembly factor 3-like [Portunus trituberculatus]|uniref:Dynein assembly factor 3, axonemal n=1 Tax=Portunus trituberculatus TaxID=210409 RepID=A0A5B7CHD1_PORTR|nr:dynein axonemal assembly factor 3-like [Portunus trituberculatus]MPC07846.1 Dynein assembly factor 3, axonemal [Portunus trituberculatus]